MTTRRRRKCRHCGQLFRPEIFNHDATLTSAVLDRLLHHAETVTLEGSSFRMKGRDRQVIRARSCARLHTNIFKPADLRQLHTGRSTRSTLLASWLSGNPPFGRQRGGERARCVRVRSPSRSLRRFQPPDERPDRHAVNVQDVLR